MIISEEGSPKGDGGWTENSDSMYSMYKKHLSNIKDCNDKRGCFSQLDGGYNKLTGGKDVWNFDTYGKRLILADGMQVFFEGFGTSCSRQNWWGTQGYACGQIIVDLNGEKGPNTYARDVFMFVVQENGLVPAGNMQNYNCIASSGGLSCTHKVLTEGAMNY